MNFLVLESWWGASIEKKLHEIGGRADPDRPGPATSVIYIKSLGDMIRQLIAETQDLGTIDWIWISGEGSPGNLSVGSFMDTDMSGEKTIRYIGMPPANFIPTTARHLHSLNMLLAKDAVVTFGGCECGNGSLGDGLVIAASKILSNAACVMAGSEKTITIVEGLRGKVKMGSKGTLKTFPNWRSVQIPGGKAAGIGGYGWK